MALTKITIDFETFYSKEFSLSKMTTEEYIRSDLFEVIGVAVKVDNGETEWASGDHTELLAFLLEFPWEDSIVIGQNTMFDGAILKWRFGIDAKVYADTMCMSRAMDGVHVSASLAKQVERHIPNEAKGHAVATYIGYNRNDFKKCELAEYGDYCINDVELTYQLFMYYLKQGFPISELRVIDLTLRMFINPLLELDILRLESHYQDVVKRKEELLIDAGVTREQLMSNNKLAELITELGYTPPTKISPKTGKEAFAFAKTDQGFKDLLEHDDDRVQSLANARLGNKSTLEESRTHRFIDIANRGALPGPIKYYAAHTGRFGGCLVADTKVLVLTEKMDIMEKNITDILLSDLVWDGIEFVTHEGVVFSGYAETISWDGVTGTPDHKVFTADGEVSLSEAMQRKLPIKTCRNPTEDDVDAIRKHICNN
jgi:hypothetical protein